MAEILFDIKNIMTRRAQTYAITRGDSDALFNVTAVFVPVQGAGVTNREAASGAGGVSGRAYGVLIGYRGYTGQTDLDVKRSDLFMVGATQYRVVYVDDSLPNRREAYAESTQGAR
jgi:hypothetical protein